METEHFDGNINKSSSNSDALLHGGTFRSSTFNYVWIFPEISQSRKFYVIIFLIITDSDYLKL